MSIGRLPVRSVPRVLLMGLPIFLVFLVAASPSFRAPVITPRDEPVRVMSFNIRYGTAADGKDHWDLRRDLLLEVIRAESPDVLCLQEALRTQLDEILQGLPGLGEVGVGRDDGLRAGEHASILYRRERFTVAAAGTFWLSETPEVPGSMDWGNRITRICTWARLVDGVEGRAAYVFNLHLDHQSQPSRERSAELLLGRIRGRTFPDPVVITGDFNAGETNPAVRRLIEAGWQDSFRMVHPEAVEVGTFNAFRGETGGEKIDYILVDEGWWVLGAGIVRSSREGRYPSDHFPVTAVLHLMPPR
jgi:endonuclease/exonuclease/phosphatase family metal-dependent hydrolase